MKELTTPACLALVGGTLEELFGWISLLQDDTLVERVTLHHPASTVALSAAPASTTPPPAASKQRRMPSSNGVL